MHTKESNNLHKASRFIIVSRLSNNVKTVCTVYEGILVVLHGIAGFIARIAGGEVLMSSSAFLCKGACIQNVEEASIRKGGTVVVVRKFEFH